MSPSPKESRNHHFVPQSTLRRFSIGGLRKQVWVYDKTTGRSFKSAIADAGSETDYNRLTRKDGTTFNAEVAFDQIDDMIAVVGDRLKATRSVADIDPVFKAQLADAAAVQFFRTPLIRTTLESIPRQIIERMAEMGFASGPEDEIDDAEARRQSMSLLARRQDVAQALFAKDLLLIEPAGSARIWTSDHPVLRQTHAPNGDLGFRALGIHIYLPIAADLLLGFICPSYLAGLRRMPLESMLTDRAQRDEAIASREALATGLPLRHDDSKIARFNLAQSGNSRRFIYADNDAFASTLSHMSSGPVQPEIRESLVQMGRLGEGSGRSSGITREGQWLVLYGSQVDAIPIRWNPATRLLEAETDLPQLLHDVLKRGPFTVADVYDEGRALRHIGGGVEVEILSTGSTTRFRVIHSDPWLRALDEDRV